MRETLHIGQVGKLLGLNPKTIRYYEDIGLLPKPKRTRGGYRQYTTADVERIDFVRRVRTLDLSPNEIHQLLDFRDRGKIPSPDIMRWLRDTTRQIERSISDLRALRDELSALYARVTRA